MFKPNQNTHFQTLKQYSLYNTAHQFGVETKINNHSGLGISMVWIKQNIIYTDPDVAFSSLHSMESIQKASQVEGGIISGTDSVFGLEDANASAPIGYNPDMLMAVVNKACSSHAMGFHTRLPKKNAILNINHMEKLLLRKSNFLSLILRLSPLSSTAGTMAIHFTPQRIRLFSPQNGEFSLENTMIKSFCDWFLNITAHLQCTHIALLKVIPFTQRTHGISAIPAHVFHPNF